MNFEMFDLEQAISKWRMQMLAAGIKTPMPLDELEIHLREEIERQVNLGVSESNAFAVSVGQIGQPQSHNNEFKKVERKSGKRTAIILAGVFILLLGITMILPALGKHKQRNQAALSTGATFFNTKWAGDEIYGLELGTAFAICGAGTTLFGLKRRKA
jgi:hypothetical protein